MHRLRLIVALAGTAAMLAAAAPAANAQLLTHDAPDCRPAGSDRVFSPWLDWAQYVEAPDAGFEAGGWKRNRRTAIVDANEPWRVRSGADDNALELRGGGSALSQPICVSLAHPTVRFFARSTGGSGLLTAQVVVGTSLGTLRLPVGVVPSAQRRWSPTLPMPMLANLLALTRSGWTTVRLKLTAVGADSAFQVDDVFIDPYAKR